MKFSIAIVAAALIAGVAADYATVHTDVLNIQKSVADLAEKLKATDGNSYGGGLSVHGAAQDLDKAIQRSTKDTQSTTSVTTVPQAKTIISILTEAYPHVVAATERLVAIKPNFQKIGVAGIAKGDITSIAKSTKAFTVALVAKAPAAEKKAAQSLAAKYNAKLDATVKQYST
ncbi:hypothetical protein CF336_g8453 [Tilletia laevis]|nr:hypothetical protein CF336_g8453 [Tilletia laevis]